MRLLILGKGKTGRIVAEVARERGHSVMVLDANENKDAGSLTPPSLVSFEVIIDFTTAEAVVPNLRACLATGAKVVVGTTGWYDHLEEMRALAQRKSAALLYGANFSFGVQLLYKLAELLGKEARGYHFRIDETHHVDKKDAPSGTSLVLKRVLGGEIEIVSHRTEDAIGRHRVEASNADERIVIEHESLSRRSFAYGAVRSAEWLATRTGCYDFHDVFTQIL